MISRALAAIRRWVPRRERHYVCFGVWRIYYKIGSWTVWTTSEFVDPPKSRARGPR